MGSVLDNDLLGNGFQHCCLSEFLEEGHIDFYLYLCSDSSAKMVQSGWLDGNRNNYFSCSYPIVLTNLYLCIHSTYSFTYLNHTTVPVIWMLNLCQQVLSCFFHSSHFFKKSLKTSSAFCLFLVFLGP